MISSRGDRPADADAPHAINWLPWGPARVATIMYRQMLAAPAFTQSIEHATGSGRISATMGRYYPRIAYCSTTEFMRHGAVGCLRAEDAGRFGRDYLDRAVVARIGLGADTESLALYLADNRDSAGRPLDGSHSYTVRFGPGRLPPARAFWSLTLYDRQILLHRNPLHRYSLGNRSAELRRGRDGSLTITISHRPPPRRRRSNWLPAPDGPFALYLRLFRPTVAALDGSWRPPAVVRTR